MLQLAMMSALLPPPIHEGVFRRVGEQQQFLGHLSPARPTPSSRPLRGSMRVKVHAKLDFVSLGGVAPPTRCALKPASHPSSWWSHDAALDDAREGERLRVASEKRRIAEVMRAPVEAVETN